MGTSIADKLREIGAGPGAIIEIGYRADGIDRAIADCVDEKAPGMYGWVLEVAAVGEHAILAYTLIGDNIDYQTAYGSVSWVRDGDERIFHSCSILNKVGQKTDKGILWDEPDLDCIYARLQK